MQFDWIVCHHEHSKICRRNIQTFFAVVLSNVIRLCPERRLAISISHSHLISTGQESIQLPGKVCRSLCGDLP